MSREESKVSSIRNSLSETFEVRKSIMDVWWYMSLLLCCYEWIGFHSSLFSRGFLSSKLLFLSFYPSLPSEWCCPYQTWSADADWEKRSCWSPSLCPHKCLWSCAGLVVHLGRWLYFCGVSFGLGQLFGVVCARSHRTRLCCACMCEGVTQKWEQAAHGKEESSTALSRSCNDLR